MLSIHHDSGTFHWLFLVAHSWMGVHLDFRPRADPEAKSCHENNERAEDRSAVPNQYNAVLPIFLQNARGQSSANLRSKDQPGEIRYCHHGSKFFPRNASNKVAYHNVSI